MTTEEQQIVTKTRAEHAQLISAALVKGVEAAIEAGHRLAVAQGELTRPEFLAMLHEDLRITEGTASKLKSIASHPILSELSHGKALPPNWSVLYALTQVPQARLISAIESGDIHPDMERRDVKLLQSPKPPPKPPKPKQRDDDLPPNYEGSGAPAPDTEPAGGKPNPIAVAWANASTLEKQIFVREHWTEIAQISKLTGNGNAGADHWAHLSKENTEAVDRWIESDK
jgi:hypothetical protein